MVMKDYWSKLKLNECWSDKQRFNIIMDYIDSKLPNDNATESSNSTDKNDDVPVTATLNITVNDDEGEAVDSANILFVNTDTNEEISKTTGNKGGCNPTLNIGEYTITISKEGYVTLEESINVTEDTELTFTLEKETEDNINTNEI